MNYQLRHPVSLTGAYELSERLVIVTGGGKGFGLAITQHLLNDGFSVLVASRTKSEALADVENRHADSVYFESFDMSNTSEIHKWCTSVIKRYGVPYGLVNNSAIAHDGILGTMHESQIIETININVTATIILTKYISRQMLREGTGRIVNVSSIIGKTGFSGLSVYAASKSALIGFTKSLARELGKANITVNAIAPGYMETGMTKEISETHLEQIKRRSALRRLTSTHETASAVVYLLSESAGAITGTTITVDAGSTA